MFDFFPPSSSNQITPQYFGALVEMGNPLAYAWRRSNGSYHYTTYHLLDTP